MSSMPEPEWDDDSRVLAIAFDTLTRRTGANGEYLPEATHPGGDPEEYASGWRYVADGPFTNWAEKARLDAVEARRKELGENANMHGVFYVPRRLDFEVPPTE